MSSKKQKKSKGVTMTLAAFTSKLEGETGALTPGAGQNIVYADKKSKMPLMSSWADEVEEDAGFYEKERIILPSGTRSSRGLHYEDHEIPKVPPFTAHLGNLPYDISEDEIFKFFRDEGIVDLKLPRDQQTQRLRGFGYADFESREGLIEALHKNDSKMRGRPVRITLGTGQQDRRGGEMSRHGMRGGDGERRRGRPPAEDDDVDDWRSVMKPQGFEGEPEFRRGHPSGDYDSMPRGGGFRDRGYDRGPPRGPRGPPEPEEEIEFSRSQMVQGPPPSHAPPSHYNTYGGRSGGGPRGGGYNRDRGDRDFYDRGDRYGGGGGGGSDYYSRGGPPHHQQQGHYPPSQHSRHHSESSDHGGGPREEGTWRRREHALSQSSQSSSHNHAAYPNAPPPPRSERSESPPVRQHLQRRDRTMSPSERDDYGRDDRRDERGDEDDEDVRSHGPPQSQQQKERRRLVLQPRTVDKPVGEVEAGSASIFGGAKPVDTQRREREIEEKLEKLKVDDEPQTEDGNNSGSMDSTEAAGDEEQGPTSSGPPRERRERGPHSGEGPLRGGDRDRPKQFRLLTRANSGGGSKEAYIELDSPVASSVGSTAPPPPAASSASRSRMGGPMRAPPPLPITPPQSQQQAYTNQRFSLLRSDDKERGGGGSYRGRGGGPRRGDMDRPGGGRGGDFVRRGPRDHDGPMRGGGRSFDRDHGGPRGGRGGYSREGDYGDRESSRGDDFRRGPSQHHGGNNNNQSSSIGSQSEERDRDSHSEPEDDRDMIRGGGERGDRGIDKARGDFSDDDSGDFTRVEHRRGRKSYTNRMNNNAPLSSGGGRPNQPPARGGPGGDRW